MTTAKRIKTREATWRRVVAGHAASGISIRAYCAKRRVNEPTFYWWRAELARWDAVKPEAAFVPVVVKASAVDVIQQHLPARELLFQICA